MKDGLLTMQCKAKDKRYNGERLLVWADYKSIKIGGQEIDKTSKELNKIYIILI